MRGIPYRFGTLKTFLRPPILYTSIGHVANPLEVQASMYVIATSIVFFVDHVSADARDGTKIFRLVITLTHDTAARIAKEIGLAIIRGKGQPEENNKINN
jgi:hypothetical protein